MEEECLKQYFGFGPYECIFHTFFLQHLIIAKSVLTNAYYLLFFCLFLKKGYGFIASSYFPHHNMNSQTKIGNTEYCSWQMSFQQHWKIPHPQRNG